METAVPSSLDGGGDAPESATAEGARSGEGLLFRLHDRWSRLGPWGQGLVAFAIYLLASIVIWGLPVLGHLSSRYVGVGKSDQLLYVWSFKWWPYAIAHDMNPFLTKAIWAPAGVNLAWVTAIPGPSLLMAPVTAIFGPVASLNVLMLLAPTSAAWAAYLLCRKLTHVFWSALLAGTFFGFSSYEVGQMHGHLNLVLIFPVPLAAYLVLRRLEGSMRPLKFILLLALVLVAMFSVSTEIFATMTLIGGIALAGALAIAPGRKALLIVIAQVALAYVAAAALLSPYIYYALKDIPPGTFRDIDKSSTDLLSFVLPRATMVFGGNTFFSTTRHFTLNVVADGGYIPLPVLVAILLFVAARWRHRATWALLGLFVVIELLSLGPFLHLKGQPSTSLPFGLIQKLPLIKNALPDRLTLFAGLVVSVFLALWLAAPGRWVWTKTGLLAIGAVMLLPSVTTPPYHPPVALPAFYSDGVYKKYLTPGETVLVLPFGQRIGGAVEMLYLAETDMYFRSAGGHTGTVPVEDRSPTTASLTANAAQFIDPGALVVFLQEHRVGAIAVDEAYAPQWAKLLGSLGVQPIDVGGVRLYQLGGTFAGPVGSTPSPTVSPSTSVGP